MDGFRVRTTDPSAKAFVEVTVPPNRLVRLTIQHRGYENYGIDLILTCAEAIDFGERMIQFGKALYDEADQDASL